MEQRITHACGHEQAHYLTGFASQRDRKAKWLRTTTCHACYSAERRAEQASIAERAQAAIAHLDLPPLTGSERQVAWATTIRASRLAALLGDDASMADVHGACHVTDARWWIDHRNLTNPALLAAAVTKPAAPSTSPLPSVRILPHVA